MRQKISKPRDKPYFCHDVNFEFHALIRKCNHQARFISSIKVTGKANTKDAAIVDQCNRKDFHVITHNKRDFNPPDKIKVGIIYVGLSDEQEFIPKLIKLFNKFKKHKEYYNKTINVGEKITVTNRLNGIQTDL